MRRAPVSACSTDLAAQPDCGGRRRDENRIHRRAGGGRRPGQPGTRSGRSKAPTAGRGAVAGAGQALALGGGAGRHAGELLGNAFKGIGDNEGTSGDTVRGSDWGCDQLVARMFAHMAPRRCARARGLARAWNRVQRGAHEVVINGERVTLTERDEAHGLITARDFGGTRKWRTRYTADGTGHTMLLRARRPRGGRARPGARPAARR